MRVSFYTLGCKVNKYETQVMQQLFEKSGYEIAESESFSDVCVINSCTVTAVSDQKTRKLLRHIRRQNPTGIIVLTGCYPQANPATMGTGIEADIIIGNRERSNIVSRVSEYLLSGERKIDVSRHSREDVFEEMAIDTFSEHTRAFVKIEDGCDRRCSYCIIPIARGFVRSKPIAAVVNELSNLVNNGYREIVLTGINLSSYGKDLQGVTLAECVSESCKVDGIERIRLGSLEPDLVDENMLGILSGESKFCPQFHLSLQSGCERTLREMNRKYSPIQYENLVEKIRNSFQNPAITTDIMVGFPGETERDFEESMEFAERVKISQAHVFVYSRRDGTVAAKRTDQLPKETQNQRSRQMIELCTKLRRDFLEEQLRYTHEVLFERLDENGYYSGYTKNYSPVALKSETNVCGEILRVTPLQLLEDLRETRMLAEI